MIITKHKTQNTKHKTLFVAVVLALLGFSACENIDAPVEPIESVMVENYGKPVVLGEPIENAYALDVMRQAWDNLHANGRVTEDVEISTTHLM
jgi:hypothetical protein